MAVSTASTGGTGIQVGPVLSTEFTVTAFQLAAGVFGGLAAIVAARRLQTLDRKVHASELAIPIAIAGISTVVGAALLPTGEATADIL